MTEEKNELDIYERIVDRAQNEIEKVRAQYKTLAWILGIIISVGIACGTFLTYNTISDMRSDLNQRADQLANEVKVRIEKEFDQPRIKETVKIVAADKASALMSEQIKPEVAKFKDDISIQLNELEILVKAAAQQVQLENQAIGEIKNRIEAQKVAVGLVEQKANSAQESIQNLIAFTDDALRRNELRYMRIEDDLGLSRPLVRPMTGSSPVALTDFGKGMLSNSSMETLLAKYKTKLMEKAKIEGLSESSTAFDVETIAKTVVNNYATFDEEDTKLIDDYMYMHCEGKIFNLWEIAGIRFRDMMLEELGMPIPTLKR